MEIESANRQHPVPQNVMDVEFKLIGELTIRQFSYLLVFALISFAVAKSGLPIIFKYPLIPILVLSGLGFAFLPLNDITLDKWVANYIRAITSPRLRVWKHVPRVPYYFELDTTKIAVEEKGYKLMSNKQRGSIDDFLAGQKATSVDFDDETDLLAKETNFFQQIGFTPADSTKQAVNPKSSQVIPQDNKVQDDSKSGVSLADLDEDEAHTKQKFSAISNQKTQTDILQEKMAKSTNSKPEKKEENQDSSVDYKEHLKELELLKTQLLKDIEKNKFKLREGEEIDFTKNTKLQIDKKPEIDNPKVQTQEPQTKQKPKTVDPKKQQVRVKVVDDKKPKTSIFRSLFGKMENNESENKGNNGITKQVVNKPQPVNILKGSTEDNNGNILADTVVIIKNVDGDPLRALKTNKLGQFESTTPLENGEYLIEAILENYSFNTIKVKALGSAINPVKLVGTPLI